jgi:hypothetical protein
MHRVCAGVGVPRQLKSVTSDLFIKLHQPLPMPKLSSTTHVTTHESKCY